MYISLCRKSKRGHHGEEWGCSVRAGDKMTMGLTGSLRSRITPKEMLPGWCSGINGSPKSYL